MPPAFRAAATSDGNSTTWTVTIPAGTQAGDLLVMAIAFSAAGLTNTAISGWTFIGQQDAAADSNLRLYYRFAAAGEGGTTFAFAVPSGQSSLGTIAVLAYSGVDTGTPLDTSATAQTSGSATTVNTPALTPAGTDNLVVHAVAADAVAAQSWSWSAGPTERVDHFESSSFVAIGVADETAGTSVPARTVTFSASDNLAVVSAAFNPAAAAQPSGGGPLAGAGSLSGAGVLAQAGGGNLTAAGGLQGAGRQAQPGDGTLSATGGLQGAGTVTSGAAGGGALSATGTLSGAGTVATTGGGSLAGTGTLAGAATLAGGPVAGGGTLTATGALSGGGWVSTAGGAAVGLLPGGGKLEIAITTHHGLETSLPAFAIRWLTAFQDAEVTIGQNDSREARVTLSLWDLTVALFDSGRNDYLYRLFVRYHGRPAIWAPIKTEWNAAAGTVTLIARDTDRLEAHYLRDGDEATGTPITADHVGLRLLRDAANNTAEQDARFVVPLGIEDGTNTATASTATLTFAQGQQVLASMQQLAAAVGAPDFELEPYDLADAAGVAYGWYMRLNTYAAQGVDRTSGPDAVVFHCGYGLRNLDDMRAVPDQFITHAHALGDGGSPRATAYHAASSEQRGVYVKWAATQYEDFEALALPAVAQMWVSNYGLPTHQWTIDLKPDALQQWVALAGYGIGDKIIAGVKRGYMIREEPFRVRALRLKQADRLSQTVAEVTIEPPLVDPADIGTTEMS